MRCSEMFLGVKILTGKPALLEIRKSDEGFPSDYPLGTDLEHENCSGITFRDLSESVTGRIISKFQKFKSFRHPNVGLYLDARRGRHGRIFLISEHHPRTLAAYVDDKLQNAKPSTLEQRQSLSYTRTEPADYEWNDCSSHFELKHTGGSTESASILDEMFVLHICRDAVSGLEYLHSQGVVHRGLSLNNIVLFPERAVIVDHAIHEVTSGGLDIDAWIGSPEFSAPEVLLEPLFGKRIAAAPSCDAWSIGAIMLYLLRDADLPWLNATIDNPTDDRVLKTMDGVLQFAGLLPLSSQDWLFAPQSHHAVKILRRPDHTKSFAAAYLRGGCCFGLARTVHLLLDPEPASRPSMKSVLENPLFARLRADPAGSPRNNPSCCADSIPTQALWGDVPEADVPAGAVRAAVQAQGPGPDWPACDGPGPQQRGGCGDAAVGDGAGREGAWGYLSDVLHEWLAGGGDLWQLAARRGAAVQPPPVLRGMLTSPGLAGRREGREGGRGGGWGQDGRIHAVAVRDLLPAASGDAGPAVRRAADVEACAGRRRRGNSDGGAERDGRMASAAADARPDSGSGSGSGGGGMERARCAGGEAGDEEAGGERSDGARAAGDSGGRAEIGGQVAGGDVSGGGEWRGAAVRGLVEAVRAEGDVATKERLVRLGCRGWTTLSGICACRREMEGGSGAGWAGDACRARPPLSRAVTARLQSCSRDRSTPRPLEALCTGRAFLVTPRPRVSHCCSAALRTEGLKSLDRLSSQLIGYLIIR